MTLQNRIDDWKCWECGTNNANGKSCFDCGYEKGYMPPELTQLVNDKVAKGQIDELDALHDDLSIEALEAGACNAIHKRANRLVERLVEK